MKNSRTREEPTEDDISDNLVIPIESPTVDEILGLPSVFTVTQHCGNPRFRIKLFDDGGFGIPYGRSCSSLEFPSILREDPLLQTLHLQNRARRKALDWRRARLQSRDMPSCDLNHAMIRFVVCLLCTVTCVYQMYGFARQYFAYPTSVDVRIAPATIYDLPTLTVCADKIFTENQLCLKQPQLCNKNLTDDSPELLNATQHDMKGYAYQANKLYNYCGFLTEKNEPFDLTKECQNAASWVYNGVHSCWTLPSDFYRPTLNTSDRPLIVLELKLDFQSKDGLIFFHSPLIVPTNRIQGYRIPADSFHKIVFQKASLIYLERPYVTNCRDYLKENRADKNRPFSQERCIFNCLWKELLSHCGCISRNITIIEGQTACDAQQEKECTGVLKSIWRSCNDSCPISCRVEHYQTVLSGSFCQKQNLATFHIELRGSLHFSYIHKPQITPLELFSNIGGYLGVWLGLSIPIMFDILFGIMTEFRRLYACYAVRISNTKVHNFKHYHDRQLPV